MSQSGLKIDVSAVFRQKTLVAALVPLAAMLSAAASAQTNVKMVQLSLPVPPAIQQSMLVSHKAPTDVVHVAVSMPPPNPAALQAFADSVSNPKSLTYKKWATPAQLGQMFGQPQATVNAIVSYLQSKGFKITLVGDSRLTILADATVAQAESAFNTTINNYHALNANSPNRINFYSFSEPLYMPATVAPVILDISGLDDIAKPHPRLRKHFAAKSAPRATKGRFNTDPLTPTQTRTLYGTAPLYNAGLQGQNRNVAISSFDGFRLTNVPLYYTQFGLPTPPGGVGSNITVVAVDGGSGSGTPAGEGDLDIQMVLGMAPLCSFRVYDGGLNLIDVLTKEQNDNISDVISESYGWDLSSSESEACHNEHVLMTGQGITYMEATGDNGTDLEPYSYGNYEPEEFQVGGSVANTDAAGNRTNEVGWSGSAGGWALEGVPFNVLPSWQKGRNVPTNINFRLNPDVALNAAGETTGAYQFYLNGALSFDYDGTSFASPVFAGSLGVTIQQIVNLGGNKRLGRISDVVYSQNGRADVWYDITQGSNGILPNGVISEAGAYWDFVTGWGAINFAKFAQSVAVTPPTFFNVSAINAYDNTGLIPAVVEGTNPLGSASNLAAVDGLGYTLTAVKEPSLGMVATMQATFTTTFTPSKVTNLTFVMNGTATPYATIMVYVLNQATGKYEFLKSVDGTSISTTEQISVSSTTLANYMTSTGKVTALFRYLVPNDRLSQVNNYSFFMDQLRLSAIESLD